MCNGNCNQGRACDCPKPPLTRAEALAVVVIYLLSALAMASCVYLIAERIAS
jgi:hypothetical protein